MSAEIVATSQNIENIMSMLTKLENIKDDSSKLRGISLENTGWEGMDASSFNTALSNFTQKLDKTTNDITYYDNKKSSLSIAYDVNVESVLKDKLRDDMNKNPGNNITDKQINEIINKYGTDGFSDDEVKQIWDEYYAKG